MHAYIHAVPDKNYVTKCPCASKHIYMHAYMDPSVQTRMRTHMRTYTDIRTHIHAHIHAYMNAYMRAYIHARMYTYIPGSIAYRFTRLRKHLTSMKDKRRRNGCNRISLQPRAERGCGLTWLRNETAKMSAVLNASVD